MILVFVLSVLTGLIQISISELSVFGTLPILPLVLSVWIGYRYQPFLAFSVLAIAGFTISIFVINPILTILAYSITGLIMAVGVTLTIKDDKEVPLLESLVITSLGACAIVIIEGFASFDGYTFGQVMTYLVLTTGYTLILWQIFSMAVRSK